MIITYTKHAKIRMLQRQILEKEIQSLIEHPDTIRESFKERAVARKKFPQGTMEAIYRKFMDKIIVITCYWIKEE